MRIPIGMWRPAGTRQALGIEGVPFMSAGARPEIVLTWRTTTKWASNAWAGRAEALLLVGFAIQNDGRFGPVIREGAHVPVLCPNLVRRFSAREGGRLLDQNSKPRESHYQHANRAGVLERRSAFILELRWQIEARSTFLHRAAFLMALFVLGGTVVQLTLIPSRK